MNFLSLLAIIFTAIISTLLPIGLIVYYKRKYNASLLYFIMGIIGFSIFQVILRIPLIEWLSGQFWFNVHIMSNKLYYTLFLALSAGVFEEVGRFLMFKFVLINNRDWESGIAYGLGHGGVEAISMVGINYLAFIVIALHLNFQWFTDLVNIIPNVSAVTNLLIESSPSIFLLAGIERFFVIIIHIGLSLFVLNGIRIGKHSHLFYAIMFHSILNFSIIFTSSNIIVVEAIVGMCALICALYIKNKKFVWKFLE